MFPLKTIKLFENVMILRSCVHKEAKKLCESFENTLKEFQVLLKDPYVFTNEKISELKKYAKCLLLIITMYY